mgnify:CR=1 FL=1
MNIFPLILANIALIGGFYLYLVIGDDCRDLEQKRIKDVIFNKTTMQISVAPSKFNLHVWEVWNLAHGLHF